MNDDELITIVRDSFTDVHSSTSVEQVVSRGRAVRARRWIPGMAGALAVVAAAAFAVTTLLPASHRPSHQPVARLAAWTVTKKADGTVYVTIRELRDAAGLQSKLRADGVPASVRFFPSRAGHNPCRKYDGSRSLQYKVVHGLHPAHLREQTIFLIIHPSALPTGAGVGIQVTSSAGYVHRAGDHRLGVALVQASPQCTGS